MQRLLTYICFISFMIYNVIIENILIDYILFFKNIIENFSLYIINRLWMHSRLLFNCFCLFYNIPYFFLWWLPFRPLILQIFIIVLFLAVQFHRSVPRISDGYRLSYIVTACLLRDILIFILAPCVEPLKSSVFPHSLLSSIHLCWSLLRIVQFFSILI